MTQVAPWDLVGAADIEFHRRLVSLLAAGDREGALVDLKEYLEVAESQLLEPVQ